MCDLLVWIVGLSRGDVDGHLALVTHNYETLRVGHDLLDIETVTWVVRQRSLDLTIVFTEDQLALVGSD